MLITCIVPISQVCMTVIFHNVMLQCNDNPKSISSFLRIYFWKFHCIFVWTEFAAWRARVFIIKQLIHGNTSGHHVIMKWRNVIDGDSLANSKDNTRNFIYSYFFFNYKLSTRNIFTMHDILCTMIYNRQMNEI